jgi:hypothetical protein
MDVKFCDCDLIVEYLKNYKEKLDEMYLWTVPNDNEVKELLDNKFIDNDDYNRLMDASIGYRRNIELKHIINSKINILNANQQEELANWIVKKWGGIKTGKGSLFALALDMEKNLKDKGKSSFDKVASYSKVLSFKNIEDFIIYDSRVAYSLNWIMLKQNAAKLYFPIPSSRNRKLMYFDFDVILKLHSKNIFNEKINELKNKNYITSCERNLYISKEYAYKQMCNVVKEINEKLWSDGRRKYPFYTEMILFSIADNVIIEDIIKTCSLSLNNL